MNCELRSLTPNKNAEEYRETHGKHVVRVDRASDVVEVGYLGISKPAGGITIRVSVFFSKDMPEGFRVSRETWGGRLAGVFGLSWGRDIETGDESFDAAFRVRGRDESAVRACLGAGARKALLAFTESDRSLSGRTGSLEVTPSGVVYIEGPYTPGTVGDVVEKAKPLIEDLVGIADALEQTTPETES
jgi:hypothetical protein